jgi:hypothetical protein
VYFILFEWWVRLFFFTFFFATRSIWDMSTIKLQCLDDGDNAFFMVDSNSGISISKTTNAVSLSNGGALTVLGGASFGGDVYIGSELYANQITLENISIGVSTVYSASFIAQNNASVPTDVTGLSFSNTDERFFKANLTVSVLKSVGNSLFELFELEGLQAEAGWTLLQSRFGDETGIQFYITSEGQIQYTSPDTLDWTSTTFRYVATKISNNGSYAELSSNTSGGLSIETLQINNTAPAILGSNNGALYSLGGAMFEKNVIIKATSNAAGIGTGGGLTVLGGAAVSESLVVGSNVSSATLTVGDITTGNIFISGTIFANEDAFMSSQWTSEGNDIFYTQGNVGIGTTGPEFALEVNGDIYAEGDVIALSDLRKKSNVYTITDSLSMVMDLRGVYYTNNFNQRQGVGVIAQEIEKVLPEVVLTDKQGYKSVAYGNIIGVLIEAIKELNCKLDSLRQG